jgi:hypothetical protein
VRTLSHFYRPRARGERAGQSQNRGRGSRISPERYYPQTRLNPGSPRQRTSSRFSRHATVEDERSGEELANCAASELALPFFRFYAERFRFSSLAEAKADFVADRAGNSGAWKKKRTTVLAQTHVAPNQLEKEESTRSIRPRHQLRTVHFKTEAVREAVQPNAFHDNTTQNLGREDGIEPPSPGWSPGAWPIMLLPQRGSDNMWLIVQTFRRRPPRAIMSILPGRFFSITREQ